MKVFVLEGWCLDTRETGDPQALGVFPTAEAAADWPLVHDAAVQEWPDQTQVNFRLALLRFRNAAGNESGSWGYLITEHEVAT